MTEVTLRWDGQALLGEGPVWDARRGVVWFVDIKRHRVHSYDPASDAARGWDAPAQVGWVLPADDGALIAGLQTGLARFDPETGAFDPIAAVEPERPGNRLNDATVAPDGTIWFGSMDDGETAATGYFYRWDGASVARTSVPAVTITNGPGVSPDGRILYHVDTLGGIIHAADMDADGGVGPSRTFVTIDPADGNPDGVCVDSAGNVWVGLWGGWCARLYAPDATLVREVRLPAANVTKIALAGPDRKTAYATTARKGLDDAALAGQPQAGGLFSFDVDVAGQMFPPALSAGGRP